MNQLKPGNWVASPTHRIYSCETQCNVKMVSKLSSDSKVESGIRLLSAWIESKMAYKGQPGLSIGIVYDQELV